MRVPKTRAKAQNEGSEEPSASSSVIVKDPR